QPILIERVTPEILESWAQSDEHLRVLQDMELKSIIVVPLLARGKVLGVLEVVATGRRAFGSRELRLMDQVAHRAALAIDNARLYRIAERAIRDRDDVLGVVAHDLRNPLGRILMQVELLRPSGNEPERRARKPAD